MPGVVDGAFVDDKKCGRFFHAKKFYGLSSEEACAEAIEANPDIIYLPLNSAYFRAELYF